MPKPHLLLALERTEKKLQYHLAMAAAERKKAAEIKAVIEARGQGALHR